MDYLCDEVVAFVDERYPTAADRDHRGLAGKSCGGYGAMVVPMLRPDVFGALASHAGDALFEAAYLPEFPASCARCATATRARGTSSSSAFAAARSFDMDAFRVIEFYGYAAAYSPDPADAGQGAAARGLETGRLLDDVWAQWLDKDPVRMAPEHADALRSMKRIYLDAGTRDEYYLDLGALGLLAGARQARRDHSLELFDGRHGGISWRYPGAIRELVTALA